MTARASGGIALGRGKEFDRIKSILEDAPAGRSDVLVGPGDDAVVLANGTVLSTDLGIEGIHFRMEWISAREAGYRTAAAGLSDLAAMAAQPVGVLASLGDPGDGTTAEELMAGVKSLAREFGMGLLGGDLTRSPGPLVVDLISIGYASRPMLRSRAHPGNEVWVTGVLGGAAAAVALWNAGEVVPQRLRATFASPRPRVAEAGWLMAAGVTAGIDLSDGLAGDAGHVAAASDAAVVIDVPAIPLHPDLAGLRLPDGVDPTELALHGGDDFELMVTAPEGLLQDRAQAFEKEFDLRLTRVGSVIEGSGVFLDTRESGGPIGLSRGGYDHFGEAPG